MRARARAWKLRKSALKKLQGSHWRNKAGWGGYLSVMRFQRFHRVTTRAFMLLLVGLAACSDTIAPEEAATPADIVVTPSRMRASVEALAHDSMCGRPAGTAYERQAAAYIADAFAQAGLAPGGTDGYLQPVSIGQRETQPSTDLCTYEQVVASQNVVGVLAGTGTRAGRWVVVGAHYDHVGWRESNGLTQVFNGADDNASGTAVVMEIARLLGAWLEAHPEAAAERRSIMFHAYGAEEIGLLGSQQYAFTPTVTGDSLYAMLNLDMVGRLRDGTLTVSGASTSPAWMDLLTASRPDGVEFLFSDDGINRSDQWSFISLWGTPALHFFTGLHADYHTPADDPPLLNYAGMTEVAQLALRVLWDLATRPDAM